MIIKENELALIHYSTTFKRRFIIEDNMNLLLNKIAIYGCTYDDFFGRIMQRAVNYEIKVVDNKMIIYPLEDYEEYYLNGEKLVKAKIVEIKASDYVDKVKKNGDFTFVLNGENGNE